MTIYWVIWGFIVLMNFLKADKVSKFLLGLFSIFLVFFIGFRHEVGGDWYNYLAMFDLISKLPFLISIIFTDVAYGAINWASFQLGYEIYTVNFICAIIFCWGIYKFSSAFRNFWLPILVLFTYTIVVVAMGYTRQGVAVGLVCMAFASLLKNPKKRVYFFWIFMAMLFHKTAVIMFFFMPLINTRFFRKKFFFWLYTIISFALIFSILWLSQKADNLYLNNSVDSSGAIRRMLMHLIPLGIYVIYYKKFKKSLNSIIQLMNLLSIMVFLTFLLAFIFSTLADRLGLYFIVFDVIVFAKFAEILTNRSKKLLIFLLTVQYTFVFYIWLYFSTWAPIAWNYKNILF